MFFSHPPVLILCMWYPTLEVIQILIIMIFSIAEKRFLRASVPSYCESCYDSSGKTNSIIFSPLARQPDRSRHMARC